MQYFSMQAPCEAEAHCASLVANGKVYEPNETYQLPCNTLYYHYIYNESVTGGLRNFCAADVNNRQLSE